MNRYKKLIILSTPLAILLAISVLWTQALKPLAIHFIRTQIPKINSSQDVVSIEVGNIDISLLKLQLSADDISIQFKGDAKNLQPLNVGHSIAQLDIFDLVIGQINLSKISIDRALWNVDLAKLATKNQATKPAKIPVDEIFSINKNIPIGRILIYNSDVSLYNSESTAARVNFNIDEAIVGNKKSEIILLFNKLGVEITQEKAETLNAEIEFSAGLSKDHLNISKFLLRLLGSNLELDANFNHVDTLLESPAGELNIKSQLNLQDARSVALLLFPQKSRIPSISGNIISSGHLNFNSFNDINGAFELNTSQVVLDHFKLGQADVKAKVSKNQIEINEINLEHPAASAKLKNFIFEQKAPYHFSTRLDFSGFELQKMFQTLGLNDIPAGFVAAGGAQCEGLLQPAPLINCNIDTELKDIWVKGSLKDSFHIVKLKQARAKGEARISKEGVKYQANLEVGSSKGTSIGEVDFEKGFDIKFDTDHLSFDDVESLADLNIKGDLKIKGSTSGDSSKGVINAAVAFNNAEIDSFRLGSFSAGLDYKDTKLVFSNMSGLINKTDYQGHLNFDFRTSHMDGAFTSHAMHGEDVLQILNKKFDLPFDASGEGKMNMKFSGPFDFWQLVFDLNGELDHGFLAGERFEKLNFDLFSDGNQINFRNVKLKKLRSQLGIDGKILTGNTPPQFDLKIRTSPLYLEESDHVIQYAPSITGIGYTDGKVTGPLNHPLFESNFTLKQVTYDKIDYPNSQGKISIDKKNFAFNGQFFGRQIQTDFVWPWSENDGFSIKVLVHELNPLFLLPLISIPQPGSDFNSRLNAEVDLSSKRRSLSTADGYIRITDFLLQRGNQSLRLEKPSSMIFKSGLSQMENINLKGEDSFLKLRMDKNSQDRVRLIVDSDLQLRMFHFLVPFMQSLSGNLVVNSQVLFKGDSFELFGEGEITDGYVSLKGFPQPIENINTPIEFSKSKIILNDITGQLGQSDVTGVGHIDILGSHNIVVSLKAIADNVELNFPDKIVTEGKADVLFSGSWLPYTLKIDYKVNRGLVEKEFEADSKQTQTLRASSFLPPQQSQALAPSLALDVNVDLTKGIIIKNKILEGEAYGNLLVQGSPEAPILKGRIDLRPGSKLIFKDTPFEIQNGVVQFQGTREVTPDIYVTANARVSDYDINLLVQGMANKNLSIKPTSQPPLSENDIFSLLALGITNQNQNLSSDTQQKQTGLEVLAAISNQSQLNKKIQQKLGLNVQLAPSIDSTKNIAVPKVVVSKKISNKVNASYSKPFTGNDQNQEIKLQYLYNNTVSFHLNYQNKDTLQQDQISNANTVNKSILGLDLEYRDEFK